MRGLFFAWLLALPASGGRSEPPTNTSGILRERALALRSEVRVPDERQASPWLRHAAKYVISSIYDQFVDVVRTPPVDRPVAPGNAPRLPD